MKRLIFFCLALAGSLLLLSACNGNSSNDRLVGQAGRYVEVNITPPIEGRFMSFITEYGAIVCFDEGLRTKFTSVDGGRSWSELPGPGINTDRYMGIQRATLLPDGTLLIYLHDEGLVTVSPDGTEQSFSIAEFDQAAAGEMVRLSLMQALGNDRLLISYSAGMFMHWGAAVNATYDDDDDDDNGQYDPDDDDDEQGGESGQNVRIGTSMGDIRNITALYELSNGRLNLIAELSVEHIVSAAAHGDTLYVVDMAGSISRYNLIDGTLLGGPVVNLGSGGMSLTMPGFMMGSNPLAAASNGDLYALYQGDLLVLDAERNVETMLEGTAFSFGAPNAAVSSMMILEGGEIVVNLLINNTTSYLLKYYWDESAVINPEKTLVVWSLEDNDFVRAAISELRRRHPDSYITYEIALRGGGAVSASDAIRTLNTRLLGGSGPDIIILDGTPLESYANRGMLLDLSDLIDTSDVYPNLLASHILDGSLYYLPMQFRMPALMGSADALSRVQTLDDLVNVIVSGNAPAGDGVAMTFGAVPEAERAEIHFDTLEELNNIMWLSGAPVIIANNRLDTDALRSYLEAIKAISDKYSLGDQDNMGGRIGMVIATTGAGRPTVLPGSLSRYSAQMTNLAAFAIDNLHFLQMMMARSGSELMPFPGLAQGAWQPSTVVSVSVDTNVQDFAVEFINTMLSPGVQRMNHGTGLPITRSAIAKQILDINERIEQMEMDEPFDVDIDSLIGALRTPAMDDTTLAEMMWGSIERLGAGRIDVEGAVREIEQSIRNYLAERS